MIDFIGAVTSGDGWRAGLVISTFGFGLRHGIDWDHVAVITDITNSQDNRRRSMLFATLYALGHATVVFVLGSLAILTGDLLPAGVDSAMERVVGATLLLLGGYVFFALARHGREFRMRSRYMLIFAGMKRLARRLRSDPVLVEIEHDHDHHDDRGHGHDAGHDHGSGVSLTTRTTVWCTATTKSTAQWVRSRTAICLRWSSSSATATLTHTDIVDRCPTTRSRTTAR